LLGACVCVIICLCASGAGSKMCVFLVV